MSREVAAPLADLPRRLPGWGDRLLGWRDRLLASPRFQLWASRFPPTRPIVRRRTRALFDLCAGFVYAQILAACLQLRLFEILADGPLPIEDLASRLSLPVDGARRLLVAAASLGLVEDRGGGRFGLGTLGAATLGNPGIAAMVAHHAAFYADLADPVGLLRRHRGGTALARYWPYAGSEGDPDRAAVEPYTRLMSVSQPFVAGQVLDAYPFRRHRRLLDIGGGDGTFLAHAARRAPELGLVLFDLPAVAAIAEERFAVEGLTGRATVFGGSFLADPLPAGCDVATLVRILHDHDDGPALAILRSAWEALEPGGTLLVAEPMADAPGRVCDAYFSFYLTAMGSGRPRNPAELSGLLRQVGFTSVRSIRMPNPMLTGLVTARKTTHAV